LPVDKLKIDKTFLTAVPGDLAAESLVMTLSDLGLSLNLDLIAEGVENGSQYAFLRRAGYREFQGYHFSPPLPRAAFLSYLAKPGGSGAGLTPAAP
jgi:sensor c-di-GMP phosphodiesterase-like protein